MAGIHYHKQRGCTYHWRPVKKQLAKCDYHKVRNTFFHKLAERGNRLFAKKRGRKKLCGRSRFLKRTRHGYDVTSAREVREKIWWIGDAIQKTGDHVAPSGLV